MRTALVKSAYDSVMLSSKSIKHGGIVNVFLFHKVDIG
jgi:hypothetical protein